MYIIFTGQLPLTTERIIKTWQEKYVRRGSSARKLSSESSRIQWTSTTWSSVRRQVIHFLNHLTAIVRRWEIVSLNNKDDGRYFIRWINRWWVVGGWRLVIRIRLILLFADTETTQTDRQEYNSASDDEQNLNDISHCVQVTLKPPKKEKKPFGI